MFLLSRAAGLEALDFFADVENDLFWASKHFRLLSRRDVKRRYFFIVIEEAHGYLPGFLQPYQIPRSGAFLR
jgi:hypothetical protein